MYSFNRASNSSFRAMLAKRLFMPVSPLYLLLKNSSKSFIKREKSSGERLSPCLTPILQLKELDILLLSLIQALVSFYKLWINFISLPFILYVNNFDHRDDLSTRSKAFW